MEEGMAVKAAITDKDNWETPFKRNAVRYVYVFC